MSRGTRSVQSGVMPMSSNEPKKLYLVELGYRVYAWAVSEDAALDAAVDAIAGLDVQPRTQDIELATYIHFGDEKEWTVGEPPSDVQPGTTLEELVKRQEMDLAEERRLAELREEFTRRQRGLF